MSATLASVFIIILSWNDGSDTCLAFLQSLRFNFPGQDKKESRAFCSSCRK
jgi:hypothetical protein